MSSRPTRRTRRQAVVESSSDDSAPESAQPADPEEEEEEEEEYTPAPAPTPRRASRRVAAAATPSAAAPTPRTTRARKTRAKDGGEKTPSVRKAAVSRARKVRKLEEPPKEEEERAVSEAPSEASAAATPTRGTRSPSATPTPSTAGERTPRAGTSRAATPQDRDRTPRAGTATPRAGTPEAATPRAGTPKTVLTTPLRVQRTPPGTTPRSDAAPTPSSTMKLSQPPSQSQNHEPIIIKSRANALHSIAEKEKEDATPKQRLVITHLVMVNFKSYAGEQIVGPFHPSFSSVVGPNGSGKSNVIDSLLFVFGFRANKMRQGKISALIHHSPTNPNPDFCEVQVHFQEVIDNPAGESDVVPNSKLVVSRKAFKNNSSKYFVNGRNSDYTAVTTMLRGLGIDLDHKRFLILQGEVESIAQMKPKAASENDDGLLEYLEDIIGTSKYKKPIEDTGTEMEEMNDVCIEKTTRVKHVEKEKNSLEGRKNAALEYIKNENDLAVKKCQLYQAYMLDSEENIQVTSEMMTQCQAQLDTELERHAGEADGIKKLEKKHKQGSKEIESIEQETQAIMREVSRLDKENVKLQEKEKFLVQKEKKLQKAIQTAKMEASSATALIERHEADTERFGSEAESLNEKLDVEKEKLEEVRAGLKEKTQVFSDQITVKQKALEPWNVKINEKTSALAVAQSELEIVLEKINANKTAVEEFESKIEVMKEARITKEAELKDCQKEQARLKKEAQKVQNEIVKMSQKEPQMASSISGARQKAQEAKSSFAASRSQGQVLSGLMRLQESGRLEGFYGRLGSLGAIDKKYDVAISTACPALENLIVETIESAQQCIEYLRKNNLGRATVMCLKQLQARDMSPIQTPENVPRLFDLIKPKDPKLAIPFYQVLGDTLVAKDLAQANRIAYGAKRYKVVTLEGQLIEKSGTLSGGGTSVSRGRMSSKLVSEMSQEAVAKIEAECEEVEQSYAQFQQQQRELEGKLRDLNEQIPELDVQMQKIGLELEASVKHQADAERRIKELSQEKGDKADSGRITALEKSVKTLQKEIDKLQAETSGIEEEIQALEDKIMEVGGMKLRGQQSIVDGLKEQIELLKAQILTAGTAKRKAVKQQKKSGDVINDSEAEVQSIAVELEELQETLKEQKKAANDSKEKAEEAQAFLENKRDELAAVKEELDEMTAELNKSRAVEIEMRSKLEEHEKSLQDSQKRTKHWTSELNKLTLTNVDDITGTPDKKEDADDDDEEDEQNQIPTKLEVYPHDEIRGFDRAALKEEIALLEELVSGARVDLSVLPEYRRRAAEFAARSADLQAAVATRDGLKQRIDDLRKRRLDEFMAGFNVISLRLKEMYQMITMGGNAELELVDSLDPFSEGILFSVMPPKKNWKNISNLSGGEKTLSSLALVFALHHFKPTPLYVMDEIDAALDFRNVSIVASYIKERTKNAQFIVISLRNNMFELAARLIGVYKVNQMTKSVTIENRNYITETDNENQKAHAHAQAQAGQPASQRAPSQAPAVLSEVPVSSQIAAP
ncbi:putative nuclear condensin complex subunit Smc4 [Geopyxis carbonaria]|nr:putative nuclear condensin complex subunit Smc4 [Geopyxis carbonaria]